MIRKSSDQEYQKYEKVGRKEIENWEFSSNICLRDPISSQNDQIMILGHLSALLFGAKNV